MEQPRLRFTLSRDVQFPKRASDHEAGIDFFIPKDLTVDSILKANEKVKDISIYQENHISANSVCLHVDEKGFVSEIYMGPHSRIIIPSGVHALIEPWNSALIAANKSGISTKKGLVFGAQVVDSTYTGEIHISQINTGDGVQVLKAGDKAIQFIHTPIYLTDIEFISWDGEGGFLDISANWSKRGSNWQGSTDLNEIEPYDDGPNS